MSLTAAACVRWNRGLIGWVWTIAVAALPFLMEIVLRGLFDPLLVLRQRDIALAVLVVGCAVAGSRVATRGRPQHIGGSVAFGLTALVVVTAAMVGVFRVPVDSIRSVVLSVRGIAAVIVSVILAGGIAVAAWWLLQRDRIRALVIPCAVVCGLASMFLLRIPTNMAQPREPGHPDVLLIILDTARSDHLSVYGYERPTTPALEQFSRKGRVYERAWSPAPWTPPAHASMFTGLLPGHHGCDGGPFDTPEPVLAEVLQKAGYATMAAVNNPILLGESGWARGFDIYRRTAERPGFSLAVVDWLAHVGDDDWKFSGDTGTSLTWVRRWWLRNRSQPRFAMINLMDPHSPYGPGGAAAGVFFDERTSAAPELPNDSEDYDSGLVRAEGASLDRTIALYDADMLCMDRMLGEFFEWFGERELDQTVVVVTADHGERLGERGLLGHALGLDEVLLRVPLIVRYPPRVQAGRTSDPVQTHGVFATILQHAGVPEPSTSFPRAPAVEQQTNSAIVAQTRQQDWYLNILRRRNPSFDPTPFAGNWGSVLEGSWKIVGSTTGVRRLYDVEADPAEERDVSGDQPEILARLAPRLEALPEFAAPPRPLEMPKDTLRILRGLGYVD